MASSRQPLSTTTPSTVLHHSPALRLGRFTCPPGHVLWNQDNLTGPWPLLALPGPSVEIRMSGRPSAVAHGACAMLYNPRQHYARRLIDGRGDRCIFVSIAPDTLRELLADHDPDVHARELPFLTHRAPVTPALYLRHLELVRRIEHHELDALQTDEAALALLYDLLAPPHHRPAPSAAHRALAHALERRLAADFTATTDLTTLAASVGASPFHAARVFRACTGATLHAFRTDLRLRAALMRLGEPGQDLAALALELGFSSHSHFTSAFRRHFGRPPSRARS